MDQQPSHVAEVAGMAVRRALPQKPRRTVGAWCFADHFGPTDATSPVEMRVGPHPHTGLSTVTWLLEGTEHHTDSLGSDQWIRPGQLNLMTAGRGVAHAEQSNAGDGVLHGVQLWVAQPEATRHGDPSFEHHAELPQLVLGQGRATVLLGELDGVRSPATAATPIVGAQLELAAGDTVVPLDPSFEHAVLSIDATVQLDGETLAPDVLARLEPGADQLRMTATSDAATSRPARVMLLGGVPFDERLVMWWNFVVRTHDEADQATEDWNADTGRFGGVASPLSRVPAPPTPW
jgi:redox-sensitive bicupin YhaK (pirin superfamily)